MPHRWITREYQDNDEQEILKLRQLVFLNGKSLEWWRWLYQKSPAGKALIVLAEADCIVGQYSVIPLKTKIGNEICLGSVSPDTMVHPDYRGQGIFTELAKKVYKLGEENHISFVLGFPNQNSHPGAIGNLGWLDLYNGLPLWGKPLNCKNILLHYCKHKMLFVELFGKACQAFSDLYFRDRIYDPMIRIETTNYFDDEFDCLWQKASTIKPIMVIRDRKYLNWRYVEKPGANYTIYSAWEKDELVGYIILSISEKTGLQIGNIIDLLIIPGKIKAARDLLSAASSYFNRMNIDIVSGLMLPHACLSKALKKNKYFLIPQYALPVKGYVGVKIIDSQNKREILSHPDNWFVTWGDSDSM